MDYVPVPLFAVISILSVHWVADFVLQSNWMATNKSSNFWALFVHVMVYYACLYAIGILLWYRYGLNPCWGIGWLVVNTIAHFFTDMFTSKWTARLWQKGDRHNFFVVVGLDQLIHAVTLLVTFYVWLNA